MVKKKMLSRQEFESLVTFTESNVGIRATAKTDICNYGQFYDTKIDNKSNAKKEFVDFYYPIYVNDYELNEEKLASLSRK